MPARSTPEKVRVPGKNARTIEFWSAHQMAVGYLKDIERHLAGMAVSGKPEDAQIYASAVIEWYQGVFAYTTPWQKVDGNREPVSRESLNLLRSLASRIDDLESIDLGDENLRTLADALDAAEEACSEGPLSNEAKRYIWSLIDEARRYMRDVEIFGTDAIKRVSFELGGILVQQGDLLERSGRKEPGEKLKAAGYFVMGGLVAGYTSEIGQALAEATLKALDS